MFGILVIVDVSRLIKVAPDSVYYEEHKSQDEDGQYDVYHCLSYLISYLPSAIKLIITKNIYITN